MANRKNKRERLKDNLRSKHMTFGGLAALLVILAVCVDSVRGSAGQEATAFEDTNHPHRRALGSAATSGTNSYFLTGNTSPYPGYTDPITVTLQAVDVNGVAKTTGGDRFMLRVEDACDVYQGETMTCMENSSSSNIAGFPIMKEMTDNGDGTYTATYGYSGSTGTNLAVSAELVGENGIWVEYYDNKSADGNYDTAGWEYQDMNYNWGSGKVTSTSASNVSVRWWAKITVPYTDTYTFDITHDPAFALYIDDVLLTDSWYYKGPQTSQIKVYLEAGRVYDYRQDLSEGGGTAWAIVEWSSSRLSKQVIPLSSFLKSERVGGPTNVLSMTVRDPSIPDKCTFESWQTTMSANAAGLITLQSRNSGGTAISESTDTYTVTLSSGSNTYTATAVHTSNGLYQATLTPIIPGSYTLTATMTNEYQGLENLPTTISNSGQSVKVTGPPISLTYTTIDGLNGAKELISQTIVVTAYDRDGNRMTYGGETIYLKIENQCTISASDVRCQPSASQDNVPGLPIDVVMADNGDGTYSHTYTISGGYGTASVSVSVLTEGAVYSEYWPNYSWSGTPPYTYYENHINNNWNTGIVPQVFQNDYISARWQGYIYAPTTETYTFGLYHDDAMTMRIGSSYLSDNGCCTWKYLNVALTANTPTAIDLTVNQGGGPAAMMLYWSRPSATSSVPVPEEAFWTVQRIGKQVYEIEIAPTSVPNSSTLESKPSTAVAGTTYTMTMQSRGISGAAYPVTDDTYSISVSCNAGSTCGSQTYSATGVHSSSGLYQAQFVPFKAGTYTVTATLTNSYTATDSAISTSVSGSGYTLTVYPGAVDSSKSYASLTTGESASATAGVAYSYTIYFVDQWDNVHFQSMSDEIAAGMVVSSVADYNDHTNYPSPIGVADLTNWQSTYGTSVTGVITDNNDGTMRSQVTISRAGNYLLSILIDGADVVGSPVSYVDVTPTSLSAPACVAQSVPTQMMAGFDYSFKIQGRDQYSNNLAQSLSAAVGSNLSATMALASNSGVTYAASIVDDSSAGIYRVDYSLPKLQTDGVYNYNIYLGGQQVSTSQVTVIPCTNVEALAWSRVAADGTITDQGTVEYTIEATAKTVSLANVPIYCSHTRIQSVDSATVTLHDGSVSALNESQLAGYGITIVQSDTTPQLNIYSTDTSIRSADFDITIKSSVTEETTWSDFTTVKINYINPSIPSSSTIESYATDHEAGTTYTVTIQSRNFAGTALTWDDDTYTVTLTQNDGNGSQSYTTTATHQSNGLYQASEIPYLAAHYSLTVTMTNSYQVLMSSSTSLSNSPQTIRVYPGQIDPLLCFTSLTGSPTTQASITYSFTISFKDYWDNLHYETLSDELAAGMTVSVVADYVNHNNYPSPIGVVDLVDWQSTYGTSITGTATDNNDGTMTATVTIYRAGTYTLTVQVNGSNVIGSPFSSLEVEPYNIDATACVPKDVPSVMWQGMSYSFQIQARDAYSNNLQKTLAQAAGSDFSAKMTLTSNQAVVYTGSLVDDSSAGVYRVDIALSTTQDLGQYAHTVTIAGQSVSMPMTIVQACSNSLAQAAGLVAAPGTTQTNTIDYTIEDAQQTISLPLVEFYCAQTPTIFLTNMVYSVNSGPNLALTESELNTYGIVIDYSTSDPKVQIHTTDYTLENEIIFELRLTSAVVEELSWADYAVVTINYSNPSVPAQCTIESSDPVQHEASTPYSLSMQSRNRSGQPLSRSDDTYTVTMARSDGLGDEVYTATATHSGNGLYSVSVTPYIGGMYSVTVHMTNEYSAESGVSTEISGSPLSIEILPGEVYPPLCYTDIQENPLTQTDVPYTFNIFFRDSRYNLHYQTMSDEIAAGMVVTVTADYVNHNNYPSWLGVPDDPNWKSTYGTSHNAVLTDIGDGTMSASITIQRAGTYEINVKIDDVHVIGSPFEYLEIEPTTILPSNCVATDVPSSIVAGFDYFFKIQARDQYNNNLPKTLAQATGGDHSAILSLQGNPSDQFSATMSDFSSYGAYRVDMSPVKSQTPGTYDVAVTLAGQLAPANQIIVEMCTNTLALSRGLVENPGTTDIIDPIFYTIEASQETRALPKVQQYCEHEPIQMIDSATVTYSDGTQQSLTEAELAASYGITLSQSPTDPLLVVQTSDLTLKDLTFDLTIRSTLVEEDFWADFATVTIEYSNPSIPAQCTIESSQTSHEAGTDYVMTLQSRNFAGSALSWDDDIYTVKMTRSDGGGSQVYTASVNHQSNGLYEAILVPEVAGEYSLSVTMQNDYTESSGTSTTVSGSPFTVTVYPGEVDPLASYKDVSGSPTTTAGSVYDFQISFVDLWDNVHYETLTDEIAAGMSVSVVADYIDHDNYPSPIGVADLADWQATYGTSITGTASDNNDGTMTGSVTIQRAGTYALAVEIDGVDIIGSPYEFLEVEPGAIHAPSCVTQDISSTMTAGYEYTFQIQARDQYSNNIAKTLTEACGNSYSVQPKLSSTPAVNFAGTITDDQYAGVYFVELSVPKSQTAGTYNYNVVFNGQTVSTPQVQIEPCTSTIAQALGLVAAPGSTTDEGTLEYIIGDTMISIDLPLIDFYCEHNPIQIVDSATVVLHNGNTLSLSEADLANYGITIVQSNSLPQLQIYSTDTSIITAQFDLTIRSTVVEEQSWANFALVRINYSNPTVPSTSTLESYSTSHAAGIDYVLTIQSRDIAGVALDHDDNTITVTMTRSDGGGSEVLSATATHTSGGLYEATLSPTPTVAGTYSLEVDLSNDFTSRTGASTKIQGSPFTVTIVPGQIDPIQSYTDLSGSPVTTAGVLYEFQISFVDLWGNLHYEGLQDELDAGMQVQVVANYINHDNWGSPIKVDDMADWRSTYGTQIPGSTADNNNGSMTASLTLFRAATYTIQVLIDGVDVSGSPYEFLEVEPTDLDGSMCAIEDFSELMYAGYDYTFDIQGRDQYGNNVKVSLEDAVGSDLSVNLSLFNGRRLQSEALVPKISDGGSPGVYKVDVQLPMQQAAGFYDYSLMLGGSQVVTPQVEILACSNSFAAEVGLLAPSGDTQVFETVYYTLGESQESIELRRVAYFCNHEPVQLFVSATMSLDGAQAKEISERQLEDYGILLKQSKTAPTLEIFSDDFNFGEAFFTIKISSTVVEEPSWADFSLVTVQYSNTYEPKLEVVSIDQGARFDPESTTSKTLQMRQDKKGTQILSPVSLDCNEDWSKILPNILDEDPSKVVVSVTLGKAADFLSYEPIKRRFTLITKEKERFEEGDFTVVVQLTDAKSNLVSYIVNFSLKCKIQKVITFERPVYYEELRYEEQVFDEAPPTPYIHSINEDGIVKIRFNATMHENVALLENELSSFVNRRRLAAQKVNDEDEQAVVMGQVVPTFSNYTRLHNSTINIDGLELQSMSVSIEPAEPDNVSTCSKKLDFKWEVISFTANELTLRLDFIWPECVSSSTSEGDFLVIAFNDQRLFEDENGKLIWPQFELKARIKRQEGISAPGQETLNTFGTVSTQFISGITILTVLLSLMMKRARGIQKLGRAFKSLQLIVFTLLIRVQLAAHVEQYLHSLQKLLTFSYFDSDLMSKFAFGTTDLKTIDVHFESMGFTTSDTITNLSPIIGFMVVLAIFANLYLLAREYAPSDNPVRVFLQGFHGGVLPMFNLFIDVTFLYLTVCCAISLYQRQQGVGIQGPSHTLAMLILLFVPAYLITLFAFNVWEVKKRGDQRVKRTSNVPEIEEFRFKNYQSTVFFDMFSFLRRVALAVVVTFGRTSILAQLLFVQLCSIGMIAYIAWSKPFQSKGQRRLELWNEFTILLLYGQVLCQTDFIEDPGYRIKSGWSLIAILTLSVATNFGYVFYTEACESIRIIKLTYFKSTQKENPRQKGQKLASQPGIEATSPIQLSQLNPSKMPSIAEQSSRFEQDSQYSSVSSNVDTKVKPRKVNKKEVIPVERLSQRQQKSKIMVNAPVQMNTFERKGNQTNHNQQTSEKQNILALIQGNEDADGFVKEVVNERSTVVDHMKNKQSIDLLIADIEGALSIDGDAQDSYRNEDPFPAESHKTAEVNLTEMNSTGMGTFYKSRSQLDKKADYTVPNDTKNTVMEVSQKEMQVEPVVQGNVNNAQQRLLEKAAELEKKLAGGDIDIL